MVEKFKAMKVLVTGARGQLGQDVLKELNSVPHVGMDFEDFDITDESAVYAAFDKHEPTSVIHCAAYTAVDKAEDEPELCSQINEIGTRNIAKACRKTDAKIVYVSTDYVFPGTGEHFHKPSDPTGALSVYGKTKLAGEEAIAQLTDKYFIVRTSWVFGYGGNNFVNTMLRLGKERASINVVCDQVGSPTYTVDLAVMLASMARSEKYGIYHATNEGICSWAEFATEIFRQVKMDTVVNPIPSSEYSAKAKRPLNSRLCKASLDEAGFDRLPHWKDALGRYLSCRFSYNNTIFGGPSAKTSVSSIMHPFKRGLEDGRKKK